MQRLFYLKKIGSKARIHLMVTSSLKIPSEYLSLYSYILHTGILSTRYYTAMHTYKESHLFGTPSSSLYPRSYKSPHRDLSLHTATATHLHSSLATQPHLFLHTHLPLSLYIPPLYSYDSFFKCLLTSLTLPSTSLIHTSLSIR